MRHTRIVAGLSQEGTCASPCNALEGPVIPPEAVTQKVWTRGAARSPDLANLTITIPLQHARQRQVRESYYIHRTREDHSTPVAPTHDRGAETSPLHPCRPLVVQLLRSPVFDQLHSLIPNALVPFEGCSKTCWEVRRVEQLRFLEKQLISHPRGVPSQPYRLESHVYVDPLVQVNGTLEQLYRTFDQPLKDTSDNTYDMPDDSGSKIRLESGIRCDEGILLHHLVRLAVQSQDSSIIVEVGFAHGISSLFLGEALRHHERGVGIGQLAPSPHAEENGSVHAGNRFPNGSRHIIFDPFQHARDHKWNGFGVKHMNCAGLPYELIEEESWYGIPSLLTHEPALRSACDVVFIDGAHAFDNTLVDLFLADKLVRVGGIVGLDDGQMEPVFHAVAYVCTNFPHWHLMGALHGNVVLFLKLDEHHRTGSEHCPIPFAGPTSLSSLGSRTPYMTEAYNSPEGHGTIRKSCSVRRPRGERAHELPNQYPLSPSFPRPFAARYALGMQPRGRYLPLSFSLRLWIWMKTLLSLKVSPPL